ncbi:uncharacterized protein [Epargyreus clarus]|uniref:uncharacterized protein n=1 Tax=Epargyreus clarus TaxID=520877 RepID=UPI003C2FBFB6
MPRFGPFIHQVHIADGFADDCDELVHRCMKVENLNFQVFCSLWKQMNMGCLYKGRILGAEIAELSEEVIHIAKHYMLKNTENFEESVAGLFIVYALLNLQPYPGFAHLRIVPADVAAIDRLELVARREKRHDVLYVLAAVLVRGPVQYHFAEREHGMDLAIRKYLEGYTSIDKLGVRPKGVFYRQNEELDIIRELGSITDRYTLAKAAISETVEFNRNLQYINENLTNDLQSSLKKIISGIYEDEKKGEGSRDDDKLLKSRRAIREKAMKQGVDPVKHLMNAEERKKRSTKQKKVSAKVKTCEFVRDQRAKPKLEFLDRLTNSERKRRLPISPRAVKRGRNCSDTDQRGTSSDSEDSDDDKSDDDDDSDSDLVTEDYIDDDYDNIQPEENPYSKTVHLSEKVTAINEEEVTVNLEEDKTQNEDTEKVDKENEQELDIQIDTLPVFIRTEDEGQLYEIEIIDSMKNASKPSILEKRKIDKKESDKKMDALKMISLMPGLTIKKIDKSKQLEEPSTSTANDFADITEIKEEIQKRLEKDGPFKMPGIPQPEKRDLKRVHLQSKFKKLGMLPIANFEPSDNLEAVEDEPMTPASNLDLGIIDD